MKKIMIVQYLCVASIFFGVAGGIFLNTWLFLLVPFGFVGCFINAAIGSFKLALAADKVIDKLNKN